MLLKFLVGGFKPHLWWWEIVALGRKDDAAQRYRAGLEVATRVGDTKTADEIRGALSDIGG